MWLINSGFSFPYDSEWIEKVEKNAMDQFVTYVRIILNSIGSKDDTYSVGFFTAEDTVNNKIHVVFIFQRIAKSNVAAPVA